MKACTFFGHSDTPAEVERLIHQAARYLIEKEGVTVFYIGTHGAFDRMAYAVIKEVQMIYPKIKYYRVLSRIPAVKDGSSQEDTLIPDGIETVPGRYSIVWRNRWMLAQSDYVITYVTHSWGGAAKFKKMAENQKKTVINLSQYMD